ncbi:MAG: hypothetical protein CVT59_09730 [Actinobacteria bacterium HGW-Actinobacteria-1]|nr:MAG: hypothetical protein CVT59_09730 [Actinobacteria bacterium HGW-Actinobacteria-1]
MSALQEWFSKLLASDAPRDADRQSPEHVLTKHASRLLRVRGVMSMGIGKDSAGRPAIIVGLASDSSDADALIPDVIEGIPVVKQSS